MKSSDFLNNINFKITEPGQGKLLISEPMLPDPNFSRTVVLLTEHDDNGSVGFVLNRMSNLEVHNLLEDFDLEGIPVYLGGPVGLNQLFFIHTVGDELEGSYPIMKNLYWGGDLDHLKFILNTGLAKQKDVRFFLGYSGWGPGQLDREIEENSWIVAGTTPEQVMSDSEEFWKEVMKGLGKKFEMMTQFPRDPNLN